MLEDLVKQYLQEGGNRTRNEIAMLNKMIAYVNKNQLDFTDLTDDDFSDMFATVKSTREETMRKAQVALIRFYEWLQTHGEIDVSKSVFSLKSTVSQSRENTLAFRKDWYYGNYQSMMEEFAIFTKRAEIADEKRYAAYLTFAWFGIDRKTAFRVKSKEVVVSPDKKTVEIQGLITIKNPIAVHAIVSYLFSTGFIANNGRFYSKRPSEYYFGASSNMQRELAAANDKHPNEEHHFSYEYVARSSMYLKAYDSLRALMIPITRNTGKTHARIIMALLGLSEYYSPESQGSLYPYIHFYEWCRTFKEVDDMPPSE